MKISSDDKSFLLLMFFLAVIGAALATGFALIEGQSTTVVIGVGLVGFAVGGASPFIYIFFSGVW